MKKTGLTILMALLLLLAGFGPASLFAFDFGLITNQYAAYGNSDGDQGAIKYQGDLLPRFSLPLGDAGELFVSGGMTLGMENGIYYVPEILRTEFSLRFGSSVIKVGRMNYADPFAFIASGLFDGVQYTLYSKAGIINFGAWYTGLLYKKNAGITMTESDQKIYDSVLDYKNFSTTYFAPKRILASLDWEHPSIAELFSLKAALTGQLDLSKGDDKYHSQYLTLKAGIPIKRFLLELGGSVEAAQSAAEKAALNMAFAWSLGLFWNLPTSYHSRLSLTGNGAGGRINDFMTAFVPVTGNFYGDILQAKLSGLTVVKVDYTARFVKKFGTSLQASCFVRNDLGTYTSYPIGVEDKGGYILGTELFGRLVWSPVSDLQLTAGGGAFLPFLGNASDEKARWRAELTAIIALF